MLSKLFKRSVLSNMMIGLLLSSILSPVAFAADVFTVEAGSDQTINLGGTLVLDDEAYAPFLEPGPTGVGNATIDWGDGTLDTATISPIPFPSPITYLGGSHEYLNVGAYTVTVCADDLGNVITSCDSFVATVVAPDLTVSALTVDPADYSLDFTVNNIGTGDVDTVVNPMTAFDITASSPTTVPFLLNYVTASADFRTAGSTMYMSYPSVVLFPSPSFGDPEVSLVDLCAAEHTYSDMNWTFTATVDSDSTIVESDESNNTYVTTFNVCGDIAPAEPALLPDLTVSSIVMDPVDYSLDFTVNNVGAGDVDPAADANLEFIITAGGGTSPSTSVPLSSFVTAGNDFHIAGSTLLVSMYSEESSASFATLCSSGYTAEETTWTFNATVDYDDTVLESDETNNSFEATFNICGEVDEVLLPDLVIDSVTLNTDSTLHFVVSNEGTADLTSEDVVNLALYDQTSGDGSVDESFTLNDLGTSYLPVGGTIEFDSVYVVPVLPSTMLAVVDPDNLVVELTESEFEANYYRVTFPVPDPSEQPTPGIPLPSGTPPHSPSDTPSSDSNDVDEDVILAGDEDTGSDVCGTMGFVDVATDDPNYEGIYQMWCDGVIQGRDATHFAPSDFVKRDEAVKIVSRFFGYVTVPHEDIPDVTESSYSDMNTAEVLGYYVETMTDAGFFVEESIADEFRPHENMTYSEIVDFVSQVSGEEVSLDGYADTDGVTRGTFMTFIYSLLQ